MHHFTKGLIKNQSKNVTGQSDYDLGGTQVQVLDQASYLRENWFNTTSQGNMEGGVRLYVSVDEPRYVWQDSLQLRRHRTGKKWRTTNGKREVDDGRQAKHF